MELFIGDAERDYRPNCTPEFEDRHSAYVPLPICCDKLIGPSLASNSLGNRTVAARTNYTLLPSLEDLASLYDEVTCTSGGSR